jgi:hypothetical protein
MDAKMAESIGPEYDAKRIRKEKIAPQGRVSKFVTKPRLAPGWWKYKP